MHGDREKMSSSLFGKKAVFTLAAAAICFLAVEGIAAVYQVITERHLPYAGEGFDLFLRELEDGAREGGSRKMPGRRTDEPVVSLHPYLGFVYNADRETPFQGHDLSRFGFYSDVDAVYRKGSEEEFVVGIFGGSVAAHMAVRAKETLVDELSRCASLEGREVIVNSVSQGGYKQPQQLMALSYILALGESSTLSSTSTA